MLKKDMSGEPSEYKSIPAFLEVKEAVDGVDQGIVTHLVSVFGVEDLGGDIVHPGAFTKTLKERADQVRVLNSHQRRSILDVIGYPLGMKEISKAELPPKVLEKYPEATGGLMAETQFLMDTPEGSGAFSRLKSGAVSEFSFAYDTLDEDFDDKKDGGQVRNLRTLRLHEYGPVIFAMNPAAVSIGAKDSSGEPTEGKPAPDVTEKTIRIRVRDPKGFQEGSFRTINIGAKDNGIQAVIGRLKGKTTTTVQSYIFDKKKWDAKRAAAWVKSHGKSKALSYARTIQVIRDAFYDAYGSSETNRANRFWVKEFFDEHLIVEESGERTYYKIPYTYEPQDEIAEFTPRGKWVKGDYVFVERKKDEQKSKDQILREIELEQQLIENQILLAEGAGPAD